MLCLPLTAAERQARGRTRLPPSTGPTAAAAHGADGARAAACRELEAGNAYGSTRRRPRGGPVQRWLYRLFQRQVRATARSEGAAPRERPNSGALRGRWALADARAGGAGVEGRAAGGAGAAEEAHRRDPGWAWERAAARGG
jgi:hypothetical protein